ncbi:MAG: hypothetical protein JO366_05590 [Methylobacteriaceae bacterium]|nr:hypothetical protein [Methylobacteriaceae bacterium]MBV9244266.1 hypothetical protein [Methylobacteriaceae bacterium]
MPEALAALATDIAANRAAATVGSTRFRIFLSFPSLSITLARQDREVPAAAMNHPKSHSILEKVFGNMKNRQSLQSRLVRARERATQNERPGPNGPGRKSRYVRGDQKIAWNSQ